MTREELLTLRAILGDFRKGLVQLDYVEAHIGVLIEEAREGGYHCDPRPEAGISIRAEQLPDGSIKLW